MSDCRFGVSPVNYPDPDPDTTPSTIIDKLGQVESNLCKCGQIENTEHFLYEESRNIMAQNLGLELGCTT